MEPGGGQKQLAALRRRQSRSESNTNFKAIHGTAFQRATTLAGGVNTGQPLRFEGLIGHLVTLASRDPEKASQACLLLFELAAELARAGDESAEYAAREGKEAVRKYMNEQPPAKRGAEALALTALLCRPDADRQARLVRIECANTFFPEVMNQHPVLEALVSRAPSAALKKAQEIVKSLQGEEGPQRGSVDRVRKCAMHVARSATQGVQERRDDFGCVVGSMSHFHFVQRKNHGTIQIPELGEFKVQSVPDERRAFRLKIELPEKMPEDSPYVRTLFSAIAKAFDPDAVPRHGGGWETALLRGTTEGFSSKPELLIFLRYPNRATSRRLLEALKTLGLQMAAPVPGKRSPATQTIPQRGEIY